MMAELAPLIWICGGVAGWVEVEVVEHQTTADQIGSCIKTIEGKKKAPRTGVAGLSTVVRSRVGSLNTGVE